MAAKPNRRKVQSAPAAAAPRETRRFGLVDETGPGGRELWIAREHNRSRLPAVGKRPPIAAPTEASSPSKGNLTPEDCRALLDILETLVPAIWPSAEDHEFMVGRVRATVKYKEVRLKLHGTIEQQRLSGHRPLSRKDAERRIDTLDPSIGVEMIVDELARRRPDLVAAVDPAAHADLARRWESEKHEPMRLLAVTFEVLLGVEDPVHGVLRALRPSRERNKRSREADALRAWELDQLTSSEANRFRGNDRLYLNNALASYESWRTAAETAPAVTSRSLSKFLSAIPGVTKDEDGHDKVIVFLGIALIHRQD